VVFCIYRGVVVGFLEEESRVRVEAEGELLADEESPRVREDNRGDERTFAVLRRRWTEEGVDGELELLLLLV
jgi:hypothetical protein